MEGSDPAARGPSPQELPPQVGIFELPLALLPGERTPLHVFEPRYKALINECIDQDVPFGFLFRDEEAQPAATGCGAYVTEVLERLEDGRMNIVVTGAIPFRPLTRFEGPAYPEARVEWIDPVDPPASDGEQEALLATLAEGAREAFRQLLAAAGSSDAEPIDLDELDAYGMGSKIEMPPEPKQAMLDAEGEIDRLRILTVALRELAETLVEAGKLDAIARQNGHSHLG